MSSRLEESSTTTTRGRGFSGSEGQSAAVPSIGRERCRLEGYGQSPKKLGELNYASRSDQG